MEQDIQNTRPAPNDDIVIDIRNVSKRYRLQKHNRKPFLVHDAVRRLIGKKSGEEFWALRDVTFQVRRGESVAIIGGNGAGKSTLLSMVAGTLTPTHGTAKVRGLVGALLELGAGFHHDLTGRENIYLNASLLGLNREAVESQFRKIVAFSELYDFIDVPLLNYSSGMRMRLGFSVAVHINPEILLMDEVLAVGDQHFQAKCAERIASFQKRGKTLLFVSHGTETIRRLCKRVVWLHHGKLRMDGPTQEVMDAYAKASE